MITPKFLDKRTNDNRLFDIDCSDLLDPLEVIKSVTSTTCIPGGITFGAPVVNQSPIPYPWLNRTANIGKVLQVLLSGGSLPVGAQVFYYTLRFVLATNINPALEATVLLRLIDSV